ncbi:MAG TPA: serine hydrolase domain-containing protein [Patescibacteria group bacterium]|nr:serine hydrolase domain-containing protein [Patescibacteria group bacterium]
MKQNISQTLRHTAKILDAWLPYKIQYENIPGLSVGIVYQGKLVYQQGFGYANVSKKIPATPDTCYRIASISKIFTAVAIMQLVEQGKVRLNDTVTRYLPWFHIQTKHFTSQNITIRHLLSHTSGIWRDGDTPHWETDTFPNFAEVKKSLSEKTLVFPNNTVFKYSNFGFALLGEVIKQVSGMEYGEYVTTHIINPLHLKHTTPDFSEQANKWLATGYARHIPDATRQTFHHTQTNVYAPAAGFLSNVLDMARYLVALSPQNTDNILINQKSKKMLMKKHHRTGENDEAYGLGFEMYTIKKRNIVGHGGSFPGFSTFIALDAKNDIGVVVLANTNKCHIQDITTSIFATLYTLIDEPQRFNAHKKILQQNKYEGTYRGRYGDTVVVGIDTTLVSFTTDTDSPLTDDTVLHAKKLDVFTMTPRSYFDARGEEALFLFNKNKKHAVKLLMGTMSQTRIKK